jgi:hypothetical protein
MLVGYARASTQDQYLDLRHNALQHARGEKTFEDTMSGANTEQPGLQHAPHPPLPVHRWARCRLRLCMGAPHSPPATVAVDSCWLLGHSRHRRCETFCHTLLLVSHASTCLGPHGLPHDPHAWV